MEKPIENTNQCATKNNNNLGIKFTKKKFEKKIVMKKSQKSKTISKTKKAINFFGKKSCPSGKKKVIKLVVIMDTATTLETTFITAQNST